MISAGILGEAHDAYREWRDFCVAVQDAYDRWVRARGSEAGRAFQEYRRFLDLEERVSLEYAALVRLVG
jgi:hypothetical protein